MSDLVERRKILITVKLRIQDKHASDLKRQARAVNYVWNYCNETSRRAWERDRKWLSAFDLNRLTAGSSKDLDLNSGTIEQTCKRFVMARDRAKRASVRWRGRKSLGWVPFREGKTSFDGEAFRFRRKRYTLMHKSPRLHRGIDLRSGSFNEDSKGNWYMNAMIAVDLADEHQRPNVGIDLGLKDLATLSNGEKIVAPKFYRSSEEAIASAQRARRSKRARSIHLKASNRRKDFLHKAALSLAKGHGTIFVGDVDSSKLARTRMAKSVYDAGWSDFKRMLSYKALMHGGRVVEVDERYTTQVCSECGALPASRPRGIAGLGIRGWECSDCGAIHDRDVNAARNILRVGLDALAEGAAQMRSSHGDGTGRSLALKDKEVAG